ncbi:Plasmodium exported protein, unknown function [Plasmodium gonderi]|uniref:Uncharacterized protein n=1 Tax=Plasmodium gonderi TaxID=77519 RepID=A0A1Y1J9N3_PLAGO|nr:Plasmodium exported protein, unknown function [Plasmodium gonderi]GAW79206.1 Plasmodium exported protein, unknown function [Plasmodium gonderi]
MLKNSLFTKSMGVQNKFPQINGTSGFLFYVKLLIFTYVFWNSSNFNNNTSFNNPCAEKHKTLDILCSKSSRLLTQYDSYDNPNQLYMYSLEDMEDEEREERIRELISYYNVFLNYYPEHNTKDKIIKLKSPEIVRRRNSVDSGKDIVPQIRSVVERTFEYEDSDNLDDDEDDLDELGSLVETGVFEHSFYADEYHDFGIDIDDDNNLSLLDEIFEEMSMFKRKYLDFKNKILPYINQFTWNSESLYNYILIFTPLSLLLTAFFMRLASLKFLVATGAAALALYAL